MIYKKILSVKLALLVAFASMILLFYGFSFSLAQNNCNLPTVVYLGEGQAVYTLPAGFNTFIVKRFGPFRFDLETSSTYTAAGRERVWASTSNSQWPALYHDVIDIGAQITDTLVTTVVIDDDPDNRVNWWAASDPMNAYLEIVDQALVENISFTIPYSDTWSYYAQDSIGLVGLCIEAPPIETPTPTSTSIDTLTETPTPQDTPTNTPAPIDTPAPTSTMIITYPTETATATSTPTFTPHITPTAVMVTMTTATATPGSVNPTPTGSAPTGEQETDEPPFMIYLSHIRN